MPASRILAVPSAVAPPDPYTANAPLIESAIRAVCRRHRLSGAEGEDFSSCARIALIEHDYARIRAHAGRSSLQTYLAVIVTRLFQDWRNAQWGKWRPSAEATRLGPLAVRLETLISRDGLSFDQACETLWTNHRVTESRDELARLHERFPVRARRVFTTDDALATMAAPTHSPDAALAAREAAGDTARAVRALQTAIGELPPQDRLILRLRFDEALSVAEVAKMMRLEQKPLYRRLERLLAALRRRLEADGVRGDELARAFVTHGFDPGAGENAGEVRPFERDGAPAERERVS